MHNYIHDYLLEKKWKGVYLRVVDPRSSHFDFDSLMENFVSSGDHSFRLYCVNTIEISFLSFLCYLWPQLPQFLHFLVFFADVTLTKLIATHRCLDFNRAMLILLEFPDVPSVTKFPESHLAGFFPHTGLYGFS